MDIIINNITTYEQLSLCTLNKNIHCNKNVHTLYNNIKHKHIAVHKSAFIIHNNKLYTNVIVKNNALTLTNFHEIAVPGKPLSVVCSNFNAVLLTSNGLYMRELYQYSPRTNKYFTDFTKIDINEKIISFFLNDEILYISTPEYIIKKSYYGMEKIYIPNCLQIRQTRRNSMIYWTTAGLRYEEEKIEEKIDIDGVNDILDLSNKADYVLTTTGFYHLSGKKINKSFGIKHITNDFLLTDNNELYMMVHNDNSYTLITNNVSYMDSYENFIVFVTPDNTYYQYNYGVITEIKI